MQIEAEIAALISTELPRAHFRRRESFEIDEIRFRLAHFSGLRVSTHVIRGWQIRSLEDLWRELALSLHLPLSFGGGWAALDDLVRTLELDPAGAHAIIVARPEALAGRDPDSFGSLVQLLDDAGSWWAEEYDGAFPHVPTPFHTVYVTEMDSEGELDVFIKSVVLPRVNTSFRFSSR